MSEFKPAWFLPGPHIQTVWGRLVRPRRMVKLRREVIETPDGDELVLDHLDATIAAPLHFVMLHGLEGSSQSVYMQGVLSAIRRHGHAATAINFRSCARDPRSLFRMLPNRRPRFYHSGETEDFDFVVRKLAAEGKTLLAFGASLGGSELYGSSAMGGVVQFVRRRDDALTAELSGGSAATLNGSAFASGSRGEWHGSVGVDLFDTAGYQLVRDGQRGLVDRAADSEHNSVDATLRYDRFFVRASHYDESRNNGTPLQVNDTTIRQLAGGGDANAFGGLASFRGWIGNQDYFQTFSAVAADRNSERLTVEQRVPSDTFGGSVQWSRPFAQRHALLAGADFRDVSGTSDETAIAFNGTRTRVQTSGAQRLLGVFVEDIYAPTAALSVTAGIRFDSWQNSESAWSPRLAVLYKPSPGLGFSAAAYRAFRAPTLNELYRGFRVGNVLTLANEDLTAEHLTGLEAGVRLRNVRVTGFWMSMDDVVGNVTLSTTPALITRQRQNVAASISRGAEVEGQWRIGSNWTTSAGYLFTDARATSGSLDGKRIPQIPRHQATAQLLYASPTTVGAQLRWSSSQFDDDLNTLPLSDYAVVDAFIARQIAANLQLTLFAENLLDTEVEASATPVITLGQPRTIRVGVRYGR